MSERGGSSGVLIALVVVGGFLVMVVAVCAGVGFVAYRSARQVAKASVEQFEKEQAEQRARLQEQAAPPIEVGADPVPGPLTNIPHDQPIAAGDVMVRITSVSRGTPFRDNAPVKAAAGEGPSSGEHLLIRLSVENTNQTKKLDFKPWNQPHDSLGPYAGLNDDLGNIYGRVPIGPAPEASQLAPEASIDPGQSVEAALAFELPADGAKTLTLVLPAEAVGQRGQLRFEIPLDAVEGM